MSYVSLSVVVLLFWESDGQIITVDVNSITTTIAVHIDDASSQSWIDSIINMKIPLIVMILMVIIVIVACCLCFMCYKLLSCRDPPRKEKTTSASNEDSESSDSADTQPIITIQSPKYNTDTIVHFDAETSKPSPHQIVPSDSDIQAPPFQGNPLSLYGIIDQYVTTTDGLELNIADNTIAPIIPNPASGVIALHHDSPSTVFISPLRRKKTPHSDQSPSTNLLNPSSRAPGLDTPSFGHLSSGTPGAACAVDEMDLNARCFSNSIIAIDGSVYHGTYASEGMAAALTRDHGASESIKFAKSKKHSLYASSNESAKLKAKLRGRSIMDHMEDVMDYEMAKIDEDGVCLHELEDAEDDVIMSECESDDENELNDLMEEELAAELDGFNCNQMKRESGKTSTRGGPMDDHIPLEPDEFVVGSLSTVAQRDRMFSTQL